MATATATGRSSPARNRAIPRATAEAIGRPRPGPDLASSGPMASPVAITALRGAWLALAIGAAAAACDPGEVGVPGQGADGGGGGAADATGEPGRTVTIEGPAVLPHVQAFADAACNAVGACTVGTYEGHHPTAARAIDTLVSDAYGQVPSDDNALGDAHAEFALAHQAEFGIWYVIWRQRYNDGAGWDPMEDRGSITQNHYDHVHVSFDETAP